jgi:hypothetical protein
MIYNDLEALRASDLPETYIRSIADIYEEGPSKDPEYSFLNYLGGYIHKIDSFEEMPEDIKTALRTSRTLATLENLFDIAEWIDDRLVLVDICNNAGGPSYLIKSTLVPTNLR